MQAGETITKSIGQSSARWQVLGSVHEPQTVADIARHLGLARQSVQRVADALEDEGLVVSSPHPTDKRTKFLSLTPQGRNVLSAIYSRQVLWSQRLLQRLDTDQVALVTSMLNSIGDIIHAETDLVFVDETDGKARTAPPATDASTTKKGSGT
ncbi:MarR family winged helix-turn-helix transcriptional regulator [Deinococcus yavapaiensis]|uniref:MarR family winged helix-turn-helix transcriptional regulator n=1 Tax=Deinococcus yavapaiensis TaxID=309889 RepID=UPI0024827E8F|nr:MarR family transcriptional regulator [Deinococcus yavapaiensis]